MVLQSNWWSYTHNTKWKELINQSIHPSSHPSIHKYKRHPSTKTDMSLSIRQCDAKYMIWGDKKAALYILVNLPHGSMSRRYPASQDLASAWKSPDWYIPATPSAFHPLRIEKECFLHWQVQIPIEVWIWKANHYIQHASNSIRPKTGFKIPCVCSGRILETKSGFVKP